MDRLAQLGPMDHGMALLIAFLLSMTLAMAARLSWIPFSLGPIA